MEAIKAPIDDNPILEQPRSIAALNRPAATYSPAGDFSLVLRPNVDSDEHLLPIYEGPWSPDGKTWYDARISFVQGSFDGTAGQGSGAILPASDLGANGGESRYGPENKSSINQGPELSTILRAEGLRQKFMRLEKYSTQRMGEEDERSKQRAMVDIRLEKERRARELAAMSVRASSMVIAAMADEKVTAGRTSKQFTQ